ncbi:MAG: type I methionyl aminopeptidase [Leptospiraceae bacterium]|nr:type I methionyl aminopeptidase [Leptospiraceae bacterium]
MSISNENEFKGIMKVGQFVAKVRKAMMLYVESGMTTWELDQYARTFFENESVDSAPNKDYKFPGMTCISLNHEIAHGIPSQDKIMHNGDLINIDISAHLNGFYADTGISFYIGEEGGVKFANLCEAAVQSTLAGIKQARTGNPLRWIGRSINHTARGKGFKVIKNLAGHGTGRKLHEEPQVLNYEDKSERRVLNEGLVLAVESFVSNGSEYAYESSDNWTLITGDKSFAAQMEHTIIVTRKGPLIATL